MGLDFGGFGKEFAIDQVSEKLKNFNCKIFWLILETFLLPALPLRVCLGK